MGAGAGPRAWRVRNQEPGTEIVGVEQPFDVPLIDLDTGEVLDRALVGTLDLIERDGEGRIVVVDLKTYVGGPSRGSQAGFPQPEGAGPKRALFPLGVRRCLFREAAGGLCPRAVSCDSCRIRRDRLRTGDHGPGRDSGGREARCDALEARALKKRATPLRNRGQLDRALETLDRAIQLLESLRAEPDLTQVLAKEVRAELADTFGMKGGIFRRAGDLDAALTAYSTGREMEIQDGQSTYNLSNVITLSITQKGLSPTDPAIRTDLKRAIEHLETEIAGARSDEWWASRTTTADSP